MRGTDADRHGSPPEDIVQWIPDPARFAGMPLDERIRIGRLIARHLARWASHYKAWPVGNNPPVREGSLPADILSRAALIDELFEWEAEWLRAQRVNLQDFVGLFLYRGHSVLLDQHDGVPAAHIYVSASEWEDLRGTLNARGLPGDLYFRRTDLIEVIEPVDLHGGLVLQPRSYSPRQWELRISTEGPSLPDAAARQRQFAAECWSFSLVLEEWRSSLRLDDELHVALGANLKIVREYALTNSASGSPEPIGRGAGDGGDATSSRSGVALLTAAYRFLGSLVRRERELREDGASTMEIEALTRLQGEVAGRLEALRKFADRDRG